MPHLNGAMGEAREFDEISGRYLVSLEAGGGTLELEPRHLRLAAGSSTLGGATVRVRGARVEAAAQKLALVFSDAKKFQTELVELREVWEIV